MKHGHEQVARQLASRRVPVLANPSSRLALHDNEAAPQQGREFPAEPTTGHIVAFPLG